MRRQPRDEARHRVGRPRSASKPRSQVRIEAEEELNLLKGGSLWGDVYVPRFVGSRRRRIRR